MSPGNHTATGTLTSPSIHMPTLPLDLVCEILCRLPVKFLIQLKCVCKSWKSLISDPQFAKKHLDVSKTYHHHHHLVVNGRDLLFWDATISSIFSDASTTSRVPQLQLIPPEAINNEYGSGRCVSSCDGILLFAVQYQDHALLWNPSIRKFKILPPLLNPGATRGFNPHYTFGYDRFIDNYKVFAITYKRSTSITNHFEVSDYTRNPIREVSVYTLGTDSWRRIDNFPYDGPRGPGIFVSGTVNWLAYGCSRMVPKIIVSLDLENESYRTFLMPDFEKIVYYPSTLGVLRDCLCFFSNEGEFFDVWVMNEYGIKESWTKLFSIHYEGGLRPFAYTKVVYVSEDDQVLLDYKEMTGLKLDMELVVYNYKNGTSKIPRVRNIGSWMVPEVYVESLISPCS